MGYESLESAHGNTSKVPKRRQLNDLYVLDLQPLLSTTNTNTRSSNSGGRGNSIPKKMEWVKPLTRGPGPPRRAGHSAVAMGCQLLIFGGANGSRYLSDLYIFHTPTVTWSSVALGPSPSPSLGPLWGGSRGGVTHHEGEEDAAAAPPSCQWAQKISKRIKPALLPISPSQLILFGGGKVCDFSAPTFGAIPTDCYLIHLSPASEPMPPVANPSPSETTPAAAPVVTTKRKRVKS
jgi:hypothetical protein